MNISLWIAIYGAILSTAVFIWNIYNKANDKGKIKISGYFGSAVIDHWSQSEESETVIYFIIVNKGSKPVTVTGLGGTFKDGEKSAFLIKMNNHNKKLEPGDQMIEIFTDLSIINSRVKNIYVYDSIGKKYKMKNKILKQMLVEQKLVS